MIGFKSFSLFRNIKVQEAQKARKKERKRKKIMISYDWNLESKFHFHLRDFIPFYLTCKFAERHHFQNLMYVITGFVEAFLTLTLKPQAFRF